MRLFLLNFYLRNLNKIHTQTLAAMSPGSDSYEDIFAIIRRLNLPYEDSRQQYLRMVFNVLARNVDDHSKNVSFCMSRKGDWRLSPAYDVTFSVDMSAPSYVNRQSLSVNGKYESITRKDLETVAKNNDILEYNALIDRVVSALSEFEQHAKRLDTNKILIQQIANELINV
jgi:serine/threonine-protein kinase HipA